MTVTITSLQTERFKRIKAVKIEPKPEGLTVIGGGNGQGKTSVLDAIVYALGGEKYKPSEPNQRGEEKPASIRLQLSNGIAVTRSGKKGSLTVKDASGMKGNQGVLDKLLDKLALDLPRFLGSSQKQKAEVLLKIIGVGDQLKELDRKEKQGYEVRRDANSAVNIASAALESVRLEKAPDELVSIVDIGKEIKAAQAKIDNQNRFVEECNRVDAILETISGKIEGLGVQIAEAKDERAIVEADREVLRRDPRINGEIPDIDALNEKLANADQVNELVRNNMRVGAMMDELKSAKEIAGKVDEQLQKVRNARVALLAGCVMPLEGLSVADGELIYRGAKWDCMSGADQLMVGTSIVKGLNPECGFVLLDKLEQMDIETMNKFGEWAEAEGLQIIATRVSTGDECTLVIEDGCLKNGEEK